MVNQDGADYAAHCARRRHCRGCATIDNVADLDKQNARASPPSPGPISSACASRPRPAYQRTPPTTYEGPEMKYRFGRAMEKKLGIKVFGPQGF